VPGGYKEVHRKWELTLFEDGNQCAAPSPRNGGWGEIHKGVKQPQRKVEERKSERLPYQKKNFNREELRRGPKGRAWMKGRSEKEGEVLDE